MTARKKKGAPACADANTRGERQPMTRRVAFLLVAMFLLALVVLFA